MFPQDMHYSLILLILTLVFNCSWASPYAPKQIGTGPGTSNAVAIYSYDEAGNRLSDGYGQIVSMGLVSKPVAIQQGTLREAYRYGMGGKRYMRVHADQRKTYYIGGMEYQLPAPGSANSVKSIFRIHANGYSPVAQVEFDSSFDLDYIYFVQDHLGSPVAAVSNNNVQTSRYDPWGQIVNARGVAIDESKNAEAVEKIRGFTGHELIASTNSWHMNGRVYDPGIFWGPDPFIQDMGSLKGLNRYSYVHQNPLGANDPSGLQLENIHKRAILDYTGGGFQFWWEAARIAKRGEDGGVWSVEDRFQLSYLDEAIKINNQKSKSDTIFTYSGIEDVRMHQNHSEFLFNSEVDMIKRLEGLSIGDTFAPGRYLSTSLDKEVALKYASEGKPRIIRNNKVKGILLEISGYSGGDVSPDSLHEWEKEIIYGRNANFKVTHIEEQRLMHYIDESGNKVTNNYFVLKLEEFEPSSHVPRMQPTKNRAGFRFWRK